MNVKYWTIFFGSLFCTVALIFLILTYFPQVQEKLWQGVEFVISGEEAQRKPVIHYNLRRD